MRPFFSIIIPALNEERYLPLLLSDISKQTFQDFEVIVVDGGSTDKTIQKANSSKIENLKTIKSQVKNVCYQRNLGATIAKSDYLVFLDADNRIDPFFFQGLKYRQESSNSDVFTTLCKIDTKDVQENAIGAILNLYLDFQGKTKNPWIMEAMIVCKKSLFQKIKGFNPNLKISEGQDLITRAIKKGAKYQVHKDPQWTISLRRMKSQGTIKTISSIAQIELSRLSGIKLTDKKIQKLYPMQGGLYFSKLQRKLKVEKYRNQVLKIIKSIIFEDISDQKH